MAKKITFSELENVVNALPLKDMLRLLKSYSSETHIDLSSKSLELIQIDLQKHLIENGINSTCPRCGSKMIVKNSCNGQIQWYRCQNCKKSFSQFTGTFMEKTRIPWDAWVEILTGILCHTKLLYIQKKLADDYGLAGIDYKTVSAIRHKLMHAMAEMPMPKLTGVIQIDETHFRENQKGSRNLVNTINRKKEREPRYGHQPSKDGVMSNDFANVVCMVDNRGYTVAKVIGLGRFTTRQFVDAFNDYIDAPTFLCTDGNNVYQEYAEFALCRLYIRPSDYLKKIKSPEDFSSFEEYQKEKKRLYEAGETDYIYGQASMKYDDFVELKKRYKLSLARVNQFHGDLKDKLVTETRGLTTKFLPDYIGMMVFLRNWELDNGYAPRSNKDAEKILIELLKSRSHMKYKDIENMPWPKAKNSGQYSKMLKKKQDEVRAITGNDKFKFDEEDGVEKFDTRHFLERLPATTLDKLRKKYKIKKGWAKYSIISELMKQPTIKDDIIQIISKRNPGRIDEEDVKAEKAKAYVAAGKLTKK